MAQIVQRLRAADEEALQLVAAMIAQEVRLVQRLDALGRTPHAERLRQRQRGHRNGTAVGTGLDVLDEALVDLDLVERERAQIAERRVARPEIVQRNLDAKILDLVQPFERELRIRHQHGLGDLEFQPVRRDIVGSERVDDRRHQRRRMDLQRRNVDRHLHMIRQARRFRQRSADHPLAHARDQAIVLGEFDELVREHEAAHRMLPAQERLHADDLV